MSKVEKHARIIVKTVTSGSTVATISPSNDHTILPEWSESDIYIGEFLLNSTDRKLFMRLDDSTIKRVAFYEDISGSTSGFGGISVTSGTSGVDGNPDFGTSSNLYYDSSSNTLVAPNILVYTGSLSVGLNNFDDKKFYVDGDSEIDGNLYSKNIISSGLTLSIGYWTGLITGDALKLSVILSTGGEIILPPAISYKGKVITIKNYADDTILTINSSIGDYIDTIYDTINLTTVQSIGTSSVTVISDGVNNWLRI